MLRAELRAGRARDSDQMIADAARARILLAALDDLPREAPVATYASRPGEPSTRIVIDALHRRGTPVLLPVLKKRIAWAWFEGWERTVAAWQGIPQPTGPPLGPDALALAQAIIVPCLAIGSDGTRLGTGGGWYDRALPHRRPSAVIIALAREAELFATLPTEPHDLPVDAVVTESGMTWFTSPASPLRPEFA